MGVGASTPPSPSSLGAQAPPPVLAPRLGMSLPRETNLTAVAMLAPAAVGVLAVGELEVLAVGELELLAVGKLELLAVGELDLLAVGELELLAVGELDVLQAELSELPQHRCGRSAFR